MIKKNLLFVFIFLTVHSTQAQYDGRGPNERSRFRPGIMWYYTGIQPAITEKVRKYDRLIFDVTYNNWMGDLKPFKVKPTSIGLGTSLLFDYPLKKGNTLSLGWGLNHQWSHIRHDETFYHDLTNESSVYSISPVDSRTSLNFHQIALPVEFRMRKESWKHLKLHLGGKVGYLFSLHEVNRLGNPNGKTIIKDYNFQDVNPFQYSAHLRVGIRNYALFGEYHFSKLFSNNNSTQLNVFRLGLSISLF